MLGFAVGRRGGTLLARLVTPAEKVTVAILAGASPMGWGRMAAAPSRSFGGGAQMIVPVLLLTGLFWWLGRRSDQ